MDRSARLQSAAKWLKEYRGENVLRSYCKHYGVDWRCAAIELEKLGVRIDPEYLRQREVTEQEAVKARKRHRTEQDQQQELLDDWPGYPSAWDAYLAGDYEATYALQMEENERLSDIPF